MRQIIALCLFAVAAATPATTPEYEWYEYEVTELCRDSDHAADPCETGQTPLVKAAQDGLVMDGESEDKPTFKEDEAVEALEESPRFEGDESTFELIDESGLVHSFVENPLQIEPPPILAGSPIQEIMKNPDVVFYISFNNGSGPFYYAWQQDDRLIYTQSKLKNRGLEDEALVIDGTYSYYLIEPRPKDILQFAYTKYVADEKGYRANVTIISLDLWKTIFPKFSTLDYLYTLVG